MQRLVMNISTDTGTQGDTGPHLTGELAQVRWAPTVGDTGGDLTLTILPRAADTGDGFDVFADNDCLGAGFTRVPVQHTHHIDGLDTGASQEFPYVFCGDRLRAKVTPGGAAVSGRLYFWIKD